MIKILTLGDFDIIIDDKSVLEEMESQKKLLTLFKYFLIHNEIKLLPEKIIEDLCPNEDFKNPLNMIRTQVSRLRNIIDYDKFNIKPFFTIRFINNYYIFKLVEPCFVDFIEFEKEFDKDIKSLKKDMEEDRSKYEELLLLYNGKLLEGLGQEDWLVPIRSRFGRLYIKGISYYIDYLKERSMYTEIINIGEKAIEIKPYEELIHLSFMEALINLNQESYALIHYEFFTKKLYNDLGEKPSKMLMELYKRMKEKEDSDYSNVDLNTINTELLKEFDLGRAHLCDLNYFKLLYAYEKANRDRKSHQDNGIGIISLESNSYSELSDSELKKGMESLIYILFRTLRVGDIFSKWNKKQVLMLLYGLDEENIELVIDKINNQFHLFEETKNIKLNIKLKIL